MNIKKHIPNLLTCLNLLSGMAGIYFVLKGNITFGAYFIFAAAVFDFLDGFMARILKVNSEIGKQLDSLADMVTFGVLPAFIIFQMLQNANAPIIMSVGAFFIATQSALRLAKFNIDIRQTDRFIGLPTPANALFISTLPFLSKEQPWAETILNNPYILLFLAMSFALLLTAELPLLALKFKNFSFKDNKLRYLILLLTGICFLVFGIAGIPFAIISYICLSIVGKNDGDHAGKV